MWTIEVFSVDKSVVWEGIQGGAWAHHNGCAHCDEGVQTRGSIVSVSGANDWLSEGQGGGWMAAVRREMDESIAIVEDVMSRRYEPSCVTEREP